MVMVMVEKMACCGLGELNGVGVNSLEGLKQALSRARGNRMGFVLATTTQTQKGGVNRLKKLKFKEIHTFKNPNTGSTVTVWGKDITDWPVPEHDEEKDGQEGREWCEHPECY